MAQEVPIGLDQWVGLAASKGRKFKALKNGLSEFGSRLFEQSDLALKRCGFDELQIISIRTPPPLFKAQAENWLGQSASNHVLTFASERYPEILREIASPPILLFVQGNLNVLQTPGLAIVGSRKPTVSAKGLTFEWAAELSKVGFCINSGMAIGIDTHAHLGALSAQGKTLAVLGSGLNRIYPKRNLSLSQKIVDAGGALVSEFFPELPPLAEHFPRRNRIVSGLSKGTLVMEASLRSGSLITARYALEQNREVFAMPGSVRNPQSVGCHYLIKQGAKLVEGPTDIFEEFQNLSFSEPEEVQKNFGKSPLQALASDPLLDSVDYEVTALDVVADRSKLPIKAVLAKLLQYELRGLVAAVPGGYIKLGEK